MINYEARESQSNQLNCIENLENDNTNHVIPDLQDSNFKDHNRVDWSHFDKHIDTAILMHYLNSGHDCYKEINLRNETNDKQTNNELVKQLTNEIY